MSDQVMAEYTQVLGLHVLAGLIFSSSSFTMRIQTDCLFPLFPPSTFSVQGILPANDTFQKGKAVNVGRY